jgi:hypothetical protein
VNSSDDDFMQPSDEDAQGKVLTEKELAIIRMSDSHRTQGNVLTEKELASIRMSDSHRTPSKEDSKLAAQPDNEDGFPLPEPNQRKLNRQEHEADNMKKLFTTLAENTKKQLREQGGKHTMELRP